MNIHRIMGMAGRRRIVEEEAQPVVLLMLADELFAFVLSKTLVDRGLAVVRPREVSEVLESLLIPNLQKPDFAVLDLDEQPSLKLFLITRLLATNPDCRIIVTCYSGTNSAAVKAASLGAAEILLKPLLDSASITAVLLRLALPARPAPDTRKVIPLSTTAILAALQQTQWNISATARALNMPRRTLQHRMAREPEVFSRNA
jgi:two-component system response regulator RegA